MTPRESPVHIRETNPATGKKERKQVDTAKYPEYASVAEAIEDVGEPKILELINVQTKTNELNRLRALHRPGGVGKTAIREKATKLVTNEEWAELASMEGDRFARMQAIIDSHLAEAEAVLKGQVGVEDDDDDENND